MTVVNIYFYSVFYTQRGCRTLKPLMPFFSSIPPSQYDTFHLHYNAHSVNATYKSDLKRTSILVIQNTRNRSQP